MEQRVPKPSAAVAPECDMYFCSLLLAEAARQELWGDVARAAASAVDAAAQLNRRTLFFFAARALSWLALAHEKLGTSASIREQVRPLPLQARSRSHSRAPPPPPRP